MPRSIVRLGAVRLCSTLAAGFAGAQPTGAKSGGRDGLSAAVDPPAGAIRPRRRHRHHCARDFSEGQRCLGQPIVVDNRTGGGGIIAAQTVATAVADGYTLLMPSISIAYAPAIYTKLPYDTDKDLIPVMLIATQQNLLVVNPSVPAKSVLELIALAKSKPGEIRVATGGAGASDHLAMELFRCPAGINLVNVPYKGQVPGTNALIGGEVHMQISPMASLYPHVTSGKLRGLAVTGSVRAKTAPELPTIAEAGLPGYEFYVWYGLLAPAATPRPVVGKINESFNRALNSPEVRDRLAAIGIDALGGTQEKFATFLKSEIRKWTKVAKEANIKVD